MKKYLIIFLILQLNSKEIYAQNGCIDSISFSRFISPYFGYPFPSSSPFRDSADNIYINGFGWPPGDRNFNIIKFNAGNDLVWFKTFKITAFTQVTPASLNAIDSKANLIFTAGAGNNTITTVLKFDSAANFLWGKRFERSDFPSVTGTIGGVIADSNEDIYLYGTFADDNTKTNIVKLNNTGITIWSKKYGNTNLPKFHVFEKYLVSQNTSTVVLFNHFFYDADNSDDPTAKHGLQMVKINKLDGSILDQKTLMYYYDAGGNSQNIFTLKKVNYNAATGTFLLDSWGKFMPPIYRSHIFTTLDNSLDIIKSELYNTLFVNPSENINISPANEIVLTVNRPYVTGGSFENSLCYITIDKNLNIIKQKKIALSNLSFPDNGFVANIAFKKNGIINLQLSLGAFLETNNPIYLFDNSPFYQNIDSYCLGKDTAIYTKGLVFTLPVNNVIYEDAGDVPFVSTNVTPDPYVERPFPKEEICKEVSICDTIKIFGTQYHCLSNPIDSFKIIRNPLCKRVTSWQVDTAYIKILGQNDTSLYVQYLQSYRGSIKVGFGGCTLTDSIAIEVYDAKTGVNLGNDTMHCLGKTITLNAGKGFKNYQWQDGSTADSLVAVQPGMYQVSATDSCGNIFKDSLVINPFDAVLKTDHAQPICSKDTVIFTLPANLYNYNWQPATGATLNNYSWRLFPSSTIIYSISGERLPGCIISDTVLINVKTDCLPDYIYFPNAFTPNNDGLNDTYKPGINGQLVIYEFTIYNRYGQAVYKSTAPGQGWDGHFKNSKNPLPGTYVWSCKYQFAGRPVQQEQGTFTLIR